jgi:hypothetical protein
MFFRSMNLLHLHIVSQDFDSMWLKNKKHYNSFTVGFLNADLALDCIENKKRKILVNSRICISHHGK